VNWKLIAFLLFSILFVWVAGQALGHFLALLIDIAVLAVLVLLGHITLSDSAGPDDPGP
jgi:hypothetical protein